MSTAMMIKAFEGIENDPELTNCEKLVLLRWAWKCRDNAPAVIRYKTYARDLRMSVNGIKKCVAGLIAKGYLAEQAVVVTGGAKMQVPTKEGDHPVTPGGSPSDPQRDHPVTPLQNNKNKKARARASCPKTPPFEGLTEFQKSSLRTGRSMSLGGGHSLEPCEPEYVALYEEMRKFA
jgi:hypothetical protein